MKVTPQATVIGFIGTGIMGSSMAGHIRKAGYALRVHNRTRAKAAALEKAGATWCDSPSEVARSADVVFTIVGYPHDVRSVHLGEAGIIQTLKAGGIVVDMTTSEPSLAIEMASAYAAKGIASLDAPVSGGDVGARQARLSIMVGGDKAAYEAVLGLLQCMGKNIGLMGPAGAGQHTKMSNQISIAGCMIGTCEALLYAAKAGLDEQAVVNLVAQGAGGSWSMANLGPRIARNDFEPGFIVEHFIKDMGIALREAAAMKLSLPGLALVHQLYLSLHANGLSRKGTQALMLVLRKLAGEEKAGHRG